jgi:large subunit ribosomal protein L11
MIKEKLHITIKSQEAKPTPPIGPILGQRGLNIKEFCDSFNNQTKIFKKNIMVNAIVYVEKNNKFQIQVQNQPLHLFLKNLNKQKINIKYIYEIAEYLKQTDTRYKEIDCYSICKLLVSSANSSKIILY